MEWDSPQARTGTIHIRLTIRNVRDRSRDSVDAESLGLADILTFKLIEFGMVVVGPPVRGFTPADEDNLILTVSVECAQNEEWSQEAINELTTYLREVVT
jgi:hypothetical protein